MSISSLQLATLFTIVPVLGALGNVVGGRCVKYLGVQVTHPILPSPYLTLLTLPHPP